MLFGHVWTLESDAIVYNLIPTSDNFCSDLYEFVLYKPSNFVARLVPNFFNFLRIYPGGEMS